MSAPAPISDLIRFARAHPVLAALLYPPAFAVAVIWTYVALAAAGLIP